MEQITQEIFYFYADYADLITVFSVFFLFFAIFSYVAMGASLSRMMRKARMNHPWMVWVPFCNVYVIGDFADHYNILCEGKCTSYAKQMLAWSIVSLALSQALRSVSILLSASMKVSGLFLLMLFAYVAAAVVYNVFYSIALYKIYRLFSDKAVVLLVLSVATGVATPFIMLKLAAKEPKLPFREEEPPAPEPARFPIWHYDEF